MPHSSPHSDASDRTAVQVRRINMDVVSDHKKESQSGSLLSVYLTQIGQYRRITVEEEKTLADRIQRGDPQAQEEMVQANLRLVVKIAQDYAHFGMPLMDLIAEGNIGLMKAVARYDPRKGGKLSTYASWWIKQAIKRSFAMQNKTIRLPVHRVEKLAEIRRVAHDLERQLGRAPTNEEIGEIVRLAARKVAHLRDMGNNPASLDSPVGEDAGNVLADFISDESAHDPEQSIHEAYIQDSIRAGMEDLDLRERCILTLRFGLGDQPPLTLDVVSTQLNISKERVRQIQQRALLKIRRRIEEDKPKEEGVS